MEITEVVERILSGDRQAYARIVSHYEGSLFGYLGRMGLPQARAEEVAQETFLRAWTRLADFDPRRGAFSTWLFTIAHRLALTEFERAARHRELPLDNTVDPATEAPEPIEAIAGDERRHHLQNALRKLSVPERTAIALAYTSGLALADVTRIEGCSVGAIRTRLHRARHRLAELLEEQHD